MADEECKVFRVVEEDVNKDGKSDITLVHDGAPIVTFYDWKSILISWVSTTTALFVAGYGLIQFW